jgi:hypothetical protein
VPLRATLIELRVCNVETLAHEVAGDCCGIGLPPGVMIEKWSLVGARSGEKTEQDDEKECGAGQRIRFRIRAT